MLSPLKPEYGTVWGIAGLVLMVAFVLTISWIANRHVKNRQPNRHGRTEPAWPPEGGIAMPGSVLVISNGKPSYSRTVALKDWSYWESTVPEMGAMLDNIEWQWPRCKRDGQRMG